MKESTKSSFFRSRTFVALICLITFFITVVSLSSMNGNPDVDPVVPATLTLVAAVSGISGLMVVILHNYQPSSGKVR